MERVFLTANCPRTGAMAFPSQPEVRQAINCMPRQVPQIGKTLPFLFCSIAYLKIQSAFSVHFVVILISVSPPGNRTPLMRGSKFSKQLRSLQAKMGTTCAPDICTYLMQEAAMQVLFAPLGEKEDSMPSIFGSSLSVDWVKIPMMGLWLGIAVDITISNRMAIAFMIDFQ